MEALGDVDGVDLRAHRCGRGASARCLCPGARTAMRGGLCSCFAFARQRWVAPMAAWRHRLSGRRKGRARCSTGRSRGPTERMLRSFPHPSSRLPSHARTCSHLSRQTVPPCAHALGDECDLGASPASLVHSASSTHWFHGVSDVLGGTLQAFTARARSRGDPCVCVCVCAFS